jgi:hypothetical protein
MAEFKSDNGKFGTKRVSRTATGYKGAIQLMTGEDQSVVSAQLILNRGVGEDGEPYIEVDVGGLDERAKVVATPLLLRAFADKGLRAEKANGSGSASNLAIQVKHNDLLLAFDALLALEIPENGKCVSEGFEQFVHEQEKVRNGLEQSLMFAFGNDCHLKPKGKLPKNEMGRIQRLAQYFKNGAPEIKERFKDAGAAKGNQPA